MPFCSDAGILIVRVLIFIEIDRMRAQTRRESDKSDLAGTKKTHASFIAEEREQIKNIDRLCYY